MKAKKLGGNIKHFLRKNGEDNISAIAGQAAFFLILSFFPLALFAFALLTYFGIPTHILNTQFFEVLPADVLLYLRDILRDAYPHAIEMAFTSAVIALWSSGKGMFSITQGVFRIYKTPDRKNWFIKRLVAALYTFLMFIIVIISLIVMVIAQFFSDIILEYLDSLPYVVEALYGFRYLIMFVLLVILLAFSLKLLLFGHIKEKKYYKLKNLIPGASIIAFCWTMFSVGISIYVEWFGGFSIYGSLGTVTIVLFWLYSTMYIFLCGVQFNYIYRKKIDDFSLRNLFGKKK